MNDTFSSRFAEARREAILAGFPRLNDMQKKAVSATEGPLLILAGAGSGKTTVLIQRIVNLMRYGRGSDTQELPEGVTEDDITFLRSCAEHPPEDPERMRRLCAVEPVEPWRILAITFTNKAANELKSRLERALGESAQDVWAMTFHSACVRILRRDIENLGYGRDFTIYDTGDSLSALKHILKEQTLDEKTFPPKTVLTYISNAKGEMQSAEDFRRAAGSDYRRSKIGEVYAAYEARLRQANALDFDDLLLRTVELLSRFPEVRDRYARRFRYVLIDEYQDTNKLQYLFARAMSSHFENICVVGDDDQSIYKFRGATIENILSFEKEYKNARVIRLEQNYRSTGHILAASNAVIRHNTGRKGKELWTEHEMGDKLRLFVAEDEREEAQFVASQILAGYTVRRSWKDFAVLYRINALSNQLEYAFKRNGIPYRVVGGMKFFDRAEIKDVLAWLCILNNPHDDLRLLRAVNAPARGIGERTLETLRAAAAERTVSIWEVMEHINDYPELGRAAVRIGSFCELVNDLRAMADTVSVSELYGELLERTGYLRMLEEKNTDEDRSRAENVNELRSNILSYEKESGDTSLRGFLDEVALYTDLETMDGEADCATLMTMHSAKGLEFPVVFLVGTEEGIFPGTRAIGEPEELEEERRLCYVAMTRAKEKLNISCARRRMLFGRTMPNSMSRFIQEIPEEDMDRPMPRSTFSSAIREEGSSEETLRHQKENSFRRDRFRTAHKAPPPPPKKYSPVSPASAAPAADTPCKVGDRVRHKAFGEGVVTGLRQAGTDCLVTVKFDSVGEKRMMLRYAMQHMEVI